MTVKAKLSDIIEALEYPDDWRCYLDRNTGSVITITENEAPYVDLDGDSEIDEESGEDLEDLPAWQRTSIQEVQRALESADLLPLPSKFDVHEWDIMRRFSQAQSEPARSDLLDAIHGRGAFRSFRREIDRHELREEWFSFRGATLKEIAIEWLDEHAIDYTDA